MLYIVGCVCIGVAVLFELLSYYKQIQKTITTRKSRHVSSSSYIYKIIKYVVTIVGLAIFANWVAIGIEVMALTFCVIALITIARYKPKGWKLIGKMKNEN